MGFRPRGLRIQQMRARGLPEFSQHPNKKKKKKKNRLYLAFDKCEVLGQATQLAFSEHCDERSPWSSEHDQAAILHKKAAQTIDISQKPCMFHHASDETGAKIHYLPSSNYFQEHESRFCHDFSFCFSSNAGLPLLYDFTANYKMIYNLQ